MSVGSAKECESVMTNGIPVSCTSKKAHRGEGGYMGHHRNHTTAI